MKNARKHASPAVPNDASAPPRRPGWPGRWAAAVIVLLFLAVVVLSLQLARLSQTGPGRRAFFPYPSMMRQAEGLENLTESSTGPWGTLKTRAVMIEPTDDILPPDYYLTPVDHWYFDEWQAENIASLLESAGLTDTQVDRLLATAQYNQPRHQLRLLPDRELILDMTPEVRAKIYGELGGCDMNMLQREPFRMRADSVETWLQNSGVGESTRSLMKRLVYRRGPFLMFSDPCILMADVPSQAERLLIMRMLFRQRAVLCSIHIGPRDDVAALSRYWGAGGRESAVLPLIRSVANAGSGDLDVALLLPPIPRNLLYSYRNPENTVFRDCHWTSLNYFRTEADDRFADSDAANAAFASNYEVLTSTNYLPGDIAVLRQEDGRVIHTCNYIADGIVFTKNGGAVHRPWVLLELQTVIELYSLNAPGGSVKVEYLRLKDQPPL
ncbi:MAG: hypothetical protein V1873_05445 [Verrucomicrobiota bacterium]